MDETSITIYVLPEQREFVQRCLDAAGAELWLMPTDGDELPEYAIRPKGFMERGH